MAAHENVTGNECYKMSSFDLALIIGRLFCNLGMLFVSGHLSCFCQSILKVNNVAYFS